MHIPLRHKNKNTQVYLIAYTVTFSASTKAREELHQKAIYNEVRFIAIDLMWYTLEYCTLQLHVSLGLFTDISQG